MHVYNTNIWGPPPYSPQAKCYSYPAQVTYHTLMAWTTMELIHDNSSHVIQLLQKFDRLLTCQTWPILHQWVSETQGAWSGPTDCIELPLEAVERKNIKQTGHVTSILNNYDRTVSVTQILQCLEWDSLATRRLNWAIPEIRCTPPKEDMGIPKILTTFFIGKFQKIKHFFGCKGKEDMGIPKIFNHF